MHAISRLVLYPVVTNIQTPWVKVGLEGDAICLNAGANDMGGRLMNENITWAAGARHGQEVSSHTRSEHIAAIGRKPIRRTTLYGAEPETAFSSGAL